MCTFLPLKIIYSLCGCNATTLIIIYSSLVDAREVKEGNALFNDKGARCSSVVKAFARGAMGRRIDPSWWAH